MVDNIENGTVSVNQPNSTTTNITASNAAVINFKSFNIAAGETVNFIQPSSNSTVLNRVTGPDPSKIFGTLAANGILFIVNPNGIHFGPGAVVTANSLVASTLDIATNNFVNGNYVFEKGARDAAQILNEGQIIVDNSAALMAGAVNNKNIVVAKAGRVHLASGDKTTVSFDRRGLINVEVDVVTASKPIGINGVKIEDAAISNSGSVQGAQVLMTAKAAQNIFEDAVNISGTVRATRITEQDGIIRIVADGSVKVSGALLADQISVDANAPSVPATGTTGINPIFISRTQPIVINTGPENTGQIRLPDPVLTNTQGGILPSEPPAPIIISSDKDIYVNQGFTHKGDTRFNANRNIFVNADVAVDSGDLEFIADADLDGVGAFWQAKGTTISTSNFGNILIQSSGQGYLANIISAGDLTLRRGGAPAIYNQWQDSTVILQGSFIKEEGVTLNAGNAVYRIGKDWLGPGIFVPDTSTVQFFTDKDATIRGPTTFYNLIINEPGKIVKFDTPSPLIIINNLVLKGGYGNLLTLSSISPPQQWSINPQGQTDIQYALISNLNNIRGPPLKALHTSSAGNNTNLDLDPIWTGNGTTNNWSDPDNWDTGTFPTQFDTVTFNLANSIISINSDITVTNFICATPGTTFIFKGGSLVTILGNFTLQGAADNNIVLKSSQTGTQWKINVSNEANINLSYISVEDSNNIAGYLMPMKNSYKGLNNTNWDADIYWIGEASTSWNNVNNWATASGGTTHPAAVPGASDVAIFDGGGLVNCAIDATVNVLGFTISSGYTGKTITQGAGQTITVGATGYSQADGTFSASGDLITVNGNASITGGTFTHTANSTAETYKINLTVNGDFTLGASGTINVDGKGYTQNQGTGKPISGYTIGGGSYGGAGGLENNTGTPGVTYGSITAPINIGSGGSYSGSVGGGAVIIVVTGASSIAGTISADGSDSWAGTGSGGSVYITTGTISGAGTVSANGGTPGSTDTAGGGGRISIILTGTGADFSSYSGSTTAYGGAGASAYTSSGAAGTVYRETQAQTGGNGTLTVDNNNTSYVTTVSTTLISSSITDLPTGSVTIQNKGTLEIGNGVTLSPSANTVTINTSSLLLIDSGGAVNLTGGTLTGDANTAILKLNGGTLTTSATFSYTNIELWLAATSTFNPTTLFTVGSGALFISDVAHTFSGGLTVASGATIAHTANSTAETYKINLTIGGDLTVTGSINVNGKGYTQSQGPGKPVSGALVGGSYGGMGGFQGTVGTPGSPYGSITAPINIGSGGNYAASAGGGAIILAVTGATSVAGTISANGSDSWAGTGSGGSVYLTTSSISGAGTISANGGAPGANEESGGGGRVSVILTGSDSFGSVSFQARGGTSSSKPGAAGTVYQQTQTQGAGNGSLTIDNNNATTAASVVTSISSSVTEASVGTVTLSNKGNLTIDASQTLTITGSTSALTINANSTLTNSGTLKLTGDGVTNSGTVTLSSGSIVEYSATSGTRDIQNWTYTNATVKINGTGGIFTLGASLSCAGLDISAGTLTQSAAYTITVGSSNFAQSGGTFTGGSGAVDINGSFSLSLGIFTAPSGTFTVSGNWEQTGGTFTPGSNTVTFDGSDTQTLASGGTSFNNIVHSGSGTLRLVTNALVVGGTFVNSAGTFDADTNDLVFTSTGLATISGGTFSASSSATMTFNAGLTISGGTFTGSTGAVDVNGDFTLSAGTFTAPSSMTVNGNWDDCGGTFSANSGTVDFDNATDKTFTTLGGQAYNNITHSGAGALTISLWQYRRLLTIDHTLVTADQSGFPVLVSLTGLSNINANGTDVRFTTSDGKTLLPREIESYSGGTLVAWVKTDISSVTDTTFYMYYGNSSATEPSATSTYGSQNVWTNGYVADWHLSDPTNPTDSTSNGNNGTNSNVTATTGQVDGGGSFNGTSSYFWAASSTSLNITNAFTISLWFKPTVLTQTSRYILSKTNVAVTDNLYSVVWEYVNNTVEFYSGVYTGTAPRTGSQIALSDTNWHHIVYSYDGSTWSGYLDGASAFSVSRTFSLGTAATSLYVGTFNGAGWFTNATIDEPSISNAVRTSTWVTTEYNNQLLANQGSGAGKFISSLGAESANVLAIGGALTQSGAGNFNANGNAVTVTGLTTVTGGTYTAGAGTQTFNGGLTIQNSPTFTGSATIAGTLTVDPSAVFAPTGTITFTGTGWGITNNGTLTFSGLTISGTPSTQPTASFSVSGALTVDATKEFAPTAGTITLTGTGWGITNNGTLTFSSLTISGTPSSQPTASFSIAGALTVDVTKELAPSSGTITMTGTGWGITNNGTLTFSGLTISGTPSTQPTASFSVSGVLTVDGTKQLAPSAGTITMNNGSSIANSGTLTFYNLTIADGATVTSSGGGFGVSGTMTIGPTTAATFTPAAGDVINSAGAAGVITGYGTAQVTRTAATADYSSQYKFTTNTLTNLTVEYCGSGTAQTVSTVSYGNLKLNNSSGTSLAGNTTVSGTLTVAAGTFDANTKTMIVTGLTTVSGGTYSASTATQTFNGGLTVSGTGTFTGSSGTVDVNGDFTFSGGTFTAPSSTMFVSGAFTHSGGTWDANNGSVVLENTSDENLTLSAATTFKHLYINDGLVGYWKFDEAVGTSPADSSGYGNTGTNSGATITSATTPVHFTDANLLSFDGANDYVVTGNITLGNTFTVTTWVKSSESTQGAYTRIAETMYNNGFYLGTDVGGTKFQWIVNNGTAPFGGLVSSAFTVDTWYFLAGTYDGTTGRLYVNGSEAGNTSFTAPGSVTRPLYVGAYSGGPSSTYNWAGLIDDVRVYNRTLSAQEIQALAAGNQPATSAATTTVTSGDLDVNGNLVINAGTLSAGTRDITVAANWENNGGKFTPGSKTVTLDGTSGSNIILSGSQSFNNLAITGNGGTWALSDNLAVSGTFAQSNGTFNGNGYTNTVTGLATISGGTYTTGAGTQTFNGGLTIQNSPTFTGSATVAGILTVDPSAVFAPTGTITFTGTGWGITNNGSLTFSGLTIGGTPTSQTAASFSVAGALTVNNGVTFAPTGTITMNNGSSIVNNGTALTFNGLTIASGATVSTSSSFSIGGALTLGDASSNFSPSAGTVTMNTGWSIVNASAGTLAFSGLTISGDPSIQPDSSFSIGGALTVDATKTLAPSAGTITMNNGSSIANSGTLTFNNLTIADGATVTSSGGGFGVSGTMTIGPTTAATFTPAAGDVINSAAAAGVITGYGTAQVTRTAATADYSSQYKFITNTLTNLTVEYCGSGAAQTVSTVSYGNLKLNNSSGTSLAANTTVSGTLTVAAGTFDANTKTMTVTGLATVSGGTYSASTATQTFNGGLTISGGTFTGAGGNVDVNGTLALSSGTLTAPTGTFKVSADFTITSGVGTTFNHSSATVIFDGTTILTSGGKTFNNIQVGSSTAQGSLTLADDLDLNGGLSGGTGSSSDALDISNRTINAAGNFNLNSIENFTSTGSTVVFDGGGTTQNLSGNSKVFNNITIGTNAAGASVALLNTLDMTGTLTFNNSLGSTVLDSSNQTVKYAGATLNLTNATTFTATGSTWIFYNTVSLTSAGKTFNNIQVGSSTSAGSLTLADSLDINGNLTGGSGGTNALDISNRTVNIAGNLSFAYINTFTSTNSTVIFDADTGVTQTLNSNGKSFYNITHSGAGILQLTTNSLTVTGALINSGGTFDASTNNIAVTVTGLTTVSGGTYQSGSGTQAFNGGLTIQNSPTFTGSATVADILTVDPSAVFAPTGTITFTGTGWGITNNGTLTFSGLTISGTPSSQPTASFSVSGALTVDATKEFAPTAGTITFTGTGWGITNNGTLTFSGLTIGGTPTSQTAASFSVAGALTVNNGVTFAPTGTITMNNGSSIVNNGTALTFNGLTIASGATVSTSSSFSIGGALTLGDASSNLSPAAGTVTMNTGWSIVNASAGTLAFSGLTISGDPSIQPDSSFSIGGALTVDATKQLAPSAGTITMNNGSSIANSGTLTFNNLTIPDGATVTSSGGGFGVSGTMTIGPTTAATFTPAAADVINSAGAAGVITGYGTAQVTRTAATADYSSQYKFTTNTLTNLTIEYCGSGTAQTVSTVSYGNLKLNNSSGTSLAANTTVSGTLTVAAGTFDANTKTMTVTGLATVSGGTYSASTATQTFNGGLTVSGTGTFTGSTGNVYSNGDFTVSGGAFTSTSGTMFVSGAFTHSGGAWDANGGSVVLNNTSDQALTLSAATTFNHLYINDGLVGYWKFDEASGTSAADSSGYGNTGTNNGATITSATTPVHFTDGKDLSFDGTDDYVDTPYNLEGYGVTDAFTICTWAKASNKSGFLMIAEDGADYHDDSFYFGMVYSSNTLFASVNTVNGQSYNDGITVPTFTDTWVFIALTYDGSNVRVSLNGTEYWSAANSGNINSGITTLQIGRRPAGSHYFKGSLDDVRIYNRALSAQEIQALAAGNQPATSVATTTVTSGDLDVNGNLVINAGTLSAGSRDITVAGNWENNGGKFTPGSKTVTMDGTSGSNIILSGGQKFNNLYISGSGGTWNLADRLNVNSSPSTPSELKITAGTLDVRGSLGATDVDYTIHASKWTQTGGTFTCRSGTVVLDSIVNATFTPSSSFYILRIEDPSESGLVGYWKFDEENGTVAYDVSGNGNNGTLTNTPSRSYSPATAIIFDNPESMSFDGVDDYVSVADNASLDLTNTGTISLWANASNWGNNPYLVGKDVNDSSDLTNYRLEYYNGELYITLGSGTGYSQVGRAWSPSTSTWYNITALWDGANQNLYVNGVRLGAAGTQSVVPAGNNVPMQIGISLNKSDTSSRYFSGLIDDVRIYNRALSATEVTNLAAGRYASGSTGHTQTLGGNLTATTLDIDSGALSTSTFTTTVNSALNLYAGTFTGGSGTLTINGNLNIYGGTFVAPSGTFTITGDVAVTGSPTFTAGSNTVTLSGSGLQTITSGGIQFNILTVTNSSALGVKFADPLYAEILNAANSGSGVQKLTFDTTGTHTVTTTLNVNGSIGNYILLRSVTATSQWTLAPPASTTLTYVDVRDSNSTVSITASTSVNSLNNTNWTFSGTTRRVWGGGSNFTGNSFFTTTNWTGETVPTSSEIAVFDFVQTADCDIDIDNANVNGMEIGAGYTGTVTQETTRTVTIGAGGYTQAGGTFDSGSADATIDSFTQSAGTFKGGTGNITIRADLTISGGTFTAPTTLTATITSSPRTWDVPTTLNLNNFTVASPWDNTLIISSGDTIVVNGALTLTNGSINTGTVEAKGAVSIASTWDGGDATLLIDGVGDQSFTVGSGASLPGINLNSSLTTIDFAGTSSAMGNSLTIQDGTFTAPSSGFTINGNFMQSGGTFNGGTSNVTIGANLDISAGTFNAPSILTATITSDPRTWNVPGTLTVNDFTVASPWPNSLVITAGDTIVVNGTLTLTNGYINTGTINAKGNISVGSGWDGGNAAYTISGTGAQTISGQATSFTSGTVTITNTGGVVSLGAATTITTLTTNASTTFNLAGYNFSSTTFTVNGTLQLQGDETAVGGGALPIPTLGGSSLVNYTATTGSRDLQSWGYHDLTLSNGTSATFIIPAGGITVGGDLSIGNNVTFKLTGDDLTLTGSATLGTGSTVEYTATSGTRDIQNWSYQNVNINGNGGIFTVPAGLATIAGTLTVSAGTFNGNGNAVTVTGLTTVSGGTYTTGVGTQTFNGGLTVQNSPTFTGSATVAGILTVDPSAVFAPTGTITMNNGSSIANSGTLTFYNLTIADGATVTSSGGGFGVSGTMTIGPTTAATFTPAAADVINSAGAAGEITGYGTAQVTRTAATADYSSQYKFTTNTLTNLTIEYCGSGTAQTVSTVSYGNLKLNNSSGTSLAANTTVSGTLTVAAGTFNANTKTMIVTGLTTVSGGTYSASTATQTFNGGLTISGGTFTGAGGNVDVNNTLTLSSGTLTAPTGTFKVSADFTITSGVGTTFNHSSATVIFDGTTILTSGGKTFNNIQVGSSTAQGSLTLADDLDLNGGLSGGTGSSSDALDISNRTVNAAGNFNLNSIESFTSTSSTVIFDGGGTTQNLSGNSKVFNNITIGTNTAGASVTLLNTLDMTGTLTFNNSFGSTVLDSSSQTVKYAGATLNLTNATTFTATGSTWIFYNTVSLTSAGKTFNNVQVGSSTSAGSLTLADSLDINGNLTGGSGGTNALDISNRTVNIAGNLSFAYINTFTSTNSTVIFDADTGVTQTLNSNGKSFYNITHSGAGILQLTTNSLTVTGALINSGGTFDASTNNIAVTVTGLTTISGGTYQSGSGVQAFNGGLTIQNSPTFTGSATVAGILTVDPSAVFAPTGTITMNDGSSIVNNGTLTFKDLAIANGAGVSTASSFTITGDLLSSGTLTATAGTITFGGADGSTSNIDGSTNFNNLTCIIPSKILTFQNGTTQTVSGTLNINGQATGTKIVMNSDDNTNRFSLQIGSAQTIYYVNVSNSQVTGTAGNNITARNSTKGTNVLTTGDPRWVFGIDIAGAISGITSVVPVSIAVNGTVVDTQNTDASGNFTFAGVDVNDNDMLLIFVNDSLAHPASLVGKVVDSQTNVSGLAMALNQISISDAGLAIGTSFTNTNLNSAKNADTDTLYTVSGSGPYTVTFADGITLFIPTGITYAPAGAVVADDVHINGAFTPNAYSVTVHGDWDKVHGTFTSTGTVTFDTTAASILSGSTSFYNLTCATAGKTLTFTRGTEQTVTNALTLTGTTASPIIINDTGAGAVPKLTVNSGATQSINNVAVTNNDASAGIQLIARGTGSSLSGTTTNWVLGSSGTTFTWTGANSSDWNDPLNWDIGLVPSSTDIVIIPSGTPTPEFSSDVTIAKLTINTGETVSCGIYNLTIAGDLIINGSLNIGSTTLTVGGNITGAGQTLIGVNPVVNATGYVGTFTSPLGINISGTLTMHAGGMTDNTSVSLNGPAGSFVWKENIPGFIITNGNIQNWFGQNSIRPAINAGSSAFYSGGNFTPMMMPAAPVFLPAMPAGPAPAIPVAAPAPMPMAAPIPVITPIPTTVSIPTPTPTPIPTSTPHPQPISIKPSFDGITARVMLQQAPSFESIASRGALPQPQTFGGVAAPVSLPQPQKIGVVNKAINLVPRPDFSDVLGGVNLPQRAFFFGTQGRIDLVPRPDLTGFIPYTHLPQGASFSDLSSTFNMPEPVFSERFGKISAAIIIPQAADFLGVRQGLALPKPVSFERAGTKIVAPERITPMTFEGVSGQARIKVLFPGGGQVIPNFGLGIPLGAEKPLLEPEIKKEEKK